VTTTAPAREHLELPIGKLIEPVVDLRDGRNEDALADIVASIQRLGILQPLIVCPAGEKYEIIDGFTRYICAKRANLVTVPCYVYADRPALLSGIKYETAVMRLDLTPAEEAAFFHELFNSECNEDIDAVAARVGKTRGYVDNRLQLLLGDPEILQAVRDEKIKLGVAHQLNGIDDEGWRRYYLNHAIRGGATVSVVTGWVQEWKTNQAAMAGAPSPRPATESAIVPAGHDPFRCIICRETDPRFVPETLYIHTHCRLANLDRMLAAYHGDDGRS
jgi:ParB family chromosome partitioning protein